MNETRKKILGEDRQKEKTKEKKKEKRGVAPAATTEEGRRGSNTPGSNSARNNTGDIKGGR